MSETIPTEKETRKKGPWRWIIVLSLAAVLLYLAFRGVDWEEMWSVIRQGKFGMLILAMLILSVSYTMRSFRWRVLLSAKKLMSPLTVFWATSAGYLGNNVLPARAGELIRSVMIGKAADISASYVLATALTERIMDAIALVIFSLLALPFVEGIPDWLVTAAQITGAVGIVVVIGILIISRQQALVNKFLQRLPLPEKIKLRVQDVAEQFLMGMTAFQNTGRLLTFVLMTIVIWAIDVVSATTTARAFGLNPSPPEVLLFLAALGLASAAPSTPGYVGIYQFVAVTVLTPFGLSKDEALVFVLAYQAITYVLVILTGVPGLWQLGMTRKEISKLNSST